MSETLDLSVLQQSPTMKGSVQELYALSYQGRPAFIARTSDAGSVFDVGTFFTIPGSGVARSVLRHIVFSRLEDPAAWTALSDDDFVFCFVDSDKRETLQQSRTFKSLKEQGANTHHLGLVEETTGSVLTDSTPTVTSNLVAFRAFPVIKPERVTFNGEAAYDYYEYLDASRKVIALEHVVRLGVPGGSSIYDRYMGLRSQQPEKAAEFLALYGLTDPLEPWAKMPALVCDWATKYEDYDRYLSTQEAVLISGLPGEQLDEMVELLKLCTVMAAATFRSAGLQLWDLKWELAVDHDRLVVVDTLDHDSIRITKRTMLDGHSCHVHFNKQAVRDYYRILHADWHSSLGTAKRLSTQHPELGAFMDVYRRGVTNGEYPPIPPLDAEFSTLLSEKYAFVNAGVLGHSDPTVGDDLARRELEYYRSRGHLDDFLERNAAD